MIDINLLRNEPEEVKKGIALKNASPDLVSCFLDLDGKWRKTTLALDSLRGEKNKLGQEEREKSKELKEQIKKYEAEIDVLAKERDIILEQIPNLPSKDTPAGKNENGNVVLKEVGKKTGFDFEPKDYLSLTSGLIDMERAVKVAGSRFGYILGDLALMEFALVKLAFDKLIPYGFMPVLPPVMVKPEPYAGMGRLAGSQKEERYYLPQDDIYLVGSSEHTIGPLHMGEVLEEKELPRRYAGFSTCFRREAGSYGKDTKGILRVHQFDKVEMFSFSHPDDSEKEHQFLLARQEELVQALGLPYRVVSICAGDMGFTDYRQYDVEIWLPGQGKYRETHSCSNTTDFQARGIKVKYKDAKGNKNFAHMLNATAFAIGRMLIAIVENNQTKDGKIIVPEVLRSFIGKKEIAPRSK